MKIGIVGYGYVGKGIDVIFPNVEKCIADPIFDSSVKDLPNDCNVVFVCVPTPEGKDGTIDSSIVERVVDEIECDLIVIKSTVTPDVFDRITKDVVYWPEFLTEANYLTDAVQSKVNILGYDNSVKGKEVEYILKCFSIKEHTDFKHMDCKAASLIKYTINSFLATKVTFMNQIYDVLQESGSNTKWNDFADALGSECRIGDTHLQVPGPDGQRGFGGSCFPKDTSAFVNYSDKLTILEKVIEENKKMRI